MPTALQRPDYKQYTLGRLAREMRAIAERNPGEWVPHVFAPYSFLKLTCHGTRWHLRAYFGKLARPLPFSRADRELEHRLRVIRDYFAVPEGAARTFDNDHPGAVVVDWNWQELTPEESNDDQLSLESSVRF